MARGAGLSPRGLPRCPWASSRSWGLGAGTSRLTPRGVGCGLAEVEAAAPVYLQRQFVGFGEGVGDGGLRACGRERVGAGFLEQAGGGGGAHVGGCHVDRGRAWGARRGRGWAGDVAGFGVASGGGGFGIVEGVRVAG